MYTLEASRKHSPTVGLASGRLPKVTVMTKCYALPRHIAVVMRILAGLSSGGKGAKFFWNVSAPLLGA